MQQKRLIQKRTARVKILQPHCEHYTFRLVFAAPAFAQKCPRKSHQQKLARCPAEAATTPVLTIRDQLGTKQK